MKKIEDLPSQAMDGEDFYLTLGCHRASSPEQIMTEYRVRSVADGTRNTIHARHAFTHDMQI